MRPLSQAIWLSFQSCGVPLSRWALPTLPVEVVRHHGLAGGIALLPHVQPLRQRNGEAIAEAAHAHERAEVVVERAVLLHQDHDVLDVA
jgi:hypothetical protein